MFYRKHKRKLEEEQRKLEEELKDTRKTLEIKESEFNEKLRRIWEDQDKCLELQERLRKEGMDYDLVMNDGELKFKERYIYTYRDWTLPPLESRTYDYEEMKDILLKHLGKKVLEESGKE